MNPAEVMAPTEEAALRAALDHMSDQLAQAVEGRFDFEVSPPSEEPSVVRLGQLINFLLQSTGNALQEMEKCAWELVDAHDKKSAFLATISQELRTPLTLILGPLDQILMQTAVRERLPRGVLESLERMRRNGARLLTLVKDLLDFTELEAGQVRVHRQPLDVADLVNQIVEECRPVAESRQLTLGCAADPGLGHISLDPRLFEKIVLVLLGNALKFTPSGGRIDISLHLLDGALELLVADTGIGIPENKLPVIFERFLQAGGRAGRSYEGLGLGLCRVKEFTRLMGGEVGVQSVVGRGSRFWVRLPVGLAPAQPEATPERRNVKREFVSARLLALALHSAPPAQRDAVHVSAPPLPLADRPLVLIVEDNADMCAYLHSVLSSDYRLAITRSGPEALASARAASPDVILSELMLPEMSGFVFLEQMKIDPDLRAIPFILLTAQASKAAAVEGLDHGADDYVSKPFAPMELLAHVRAAWRMRQLHKELARQKQSLEEALGRLRESEARVRAIVDAAANSIITLDSEWMVQSWNRAGERIFGYATDEILGRPMQDLILPGHWPEIHDYLGRCMAGPDRRLVEEGQEGMGRRKDGSSFPLVLQVSEMGTGGARLFIGILRDITARKEAEAKLAETHRQLLEVSRQAGMAEVATSVLHNVGNVLNSVNVSVTVATELLRKSRLSGLGKATELLSQHLPDLGTYLTTDDKGRKLPPYLIKLAEHLYEEHAVLWRELGVMSQGTEHMKTVIAMQQSYARVAGVAEELSVADLLDDALAFNKDGLARRHVQVERSYDLLPTVCIEKHKLLQILINLLSNAKHALDGCQDGEPRLSVRIHSPDPGRVRIEIGDNGIGIPAENLTRIFAFGFTTKKEGHGFGLHSSANAARELGGSLTCTSPGPGQGATFTLELPCTARQP